MSTASQASDGHSDGGGDPEIQLGPRGPGAAAGSIDHDVNAQSPAHSDTGVTPPPRPSPRVSADAGDKLA